MNVYYDPEKFGLEIVGEVEFSSGSYEFDLSVVWREVATGALFVADDSGCSCPSPFEWIGRDDLKPIHKMQDLIDYFEQRKKDAYGGYGGYDVDGEIGAVIQKAFAL